MAPQWKPGLMPLPISGFRSDVPDPLIAIIDRMMSLSAADRCSTPAEVAKALEAFAGSGDLPALLRTAKFSDPRPTDQRLRQPQAPPVEATIDIKPQARKRSLVGLWLVAAFAACAAAVVIYRVQTNHGAIVVRID